MKLILIAALLSVALANTLFLRAPGYTQLKDQSAPQCITDYLTAVWAHFDLAQPTQVLNCFDDKSAALFFKHIWEFANLVQDAEHRERIHVHLDWLKLLLLDKALESTHICMVHTQDFENLLKALGVESRNPELLGLAGYIYYQANMGKLAGELPQITGALSNKNFKKAGDIAGAVKNTTASDIKTQGLALLALNGVWNGVHIALGLPDAQSVYKCWNNDTAAIRLEFIYGLAKAVADGNWKDGAANTKNWYEKTGNALVAKIPSSAWECWGNSTDTKSESDKLGVDITSKDFYHKVAQWVEAHPGLYYALQRGIKDNMDQHNFLHAGSSYGHLLQAATK